MTRNPPLDADMRRRLVTAARRAEQASEALEALIVEARDAGVSLREIAEAVGLSHMGVRKIVERRRP